MEVNENFSLFTATQCNLCFLFFPSHHNVGGEKFKGMSFFSPPLSYLRFCAVKMQNKYTH